MRVSILSAALVTAAIVPVSAYHPNRSPWANDHVRDNQQRQQVLPSPTLPSPVAGTQATPEPRRHREERRDDTYTYDPAGTSSISPIATLTPGSTSTAAASASSETTITRAVNVTLPRPPSVVPSSLPSPLPTPLDTTMYSLSGQCLKYISGLVASHEFKSCVPFSLLLSASAAYNTIVLDSIRTGIYTYINDLVAYSSDPSPSPEQCDANYTLYYKQISEKSHCATELGGSTNSKVVAKQAQRGLGNYQAMRTAASLLDPKTGVYCYLEAVASERPDDLYLWMLASGNILPATSTPTCSPCSALLMNHYGAWATNTTSLNATIIYDAANDINRQCGANFITQITQPTPGSESNDAIHMSSNPGLLIVLISLIPLDLML